VLDRLEKESKEKVNKVVKPPEKANKVIKPQSKRPVPVAEISNVPLSAEFVIDSDL
jgi:hypothetical protein